MRVRASGPHASSGKAKSQPELSSTPSFCPQGTNQLSAFEPASQEELPSQPSEESQHGPDEEPAASPRPDEPPAPEPELSTIIPPAGKPYIHPSGGREFLQASVIPLLKQGMLELVSELEADRVGLASEAAWEEDGYLPPNWQPFSHFRWGEREERGLHPAARGRKSEVIVMARPPACTYEPSQSLSRRWLANWLLEHSPPVVTEVDSFSTYSAEAKAELLFEGLSRGTGGASVSLVEAVEKLHLDSDRVAAMLAELGCEPGEDALGPDAFVSLLTSMVTDQATYQLDVLVHECLGPALHDHCQTLQDKCRQAQGLLAWAMRGLDVSPTHPNPKP
jgi:hypothetical protein